MRWSSFAAFALRLRALPAFPVWHQVGGILSGSEHGANGKERHKQTYPDKCDAHVACLETRADQRELAGRTVAAVHDGIYAARCANEREESNDAHAEGIQTMSICLSSQRSTGILPVGPAGVPPALSRMAGRMPAGPTAGTAVLRFARAARLWIAAA